MAIVQKVKVGNNWVGVTTINGGGSAGNTQKAQILLSTPNYNAILTNSTGHYIEFTFDTIDSNGVSIGEGVTCTYTITRGTSRVIVTEKYRYNTKVKFGVDKYLNEGENSIVITIVGDISGTSTSLGVTYQVVDISIESNYDISNVVDLSKKSTATIAVPFSVSGYGTKIVEWYIDGSKLDFVKSEDEIVEVKSDRVKYITISNLQQGTHSLQMVASVTINGEKFYTHILYKDIIVYTGVNKNTIIAVSMEIPSKYGITNSTPILYDVTQYSPYILNFATYSPTNKDNIPITVSLDEETIGTIGSKNNVTNEIAIVSKTTGDKTINIKDEDGNIYTIGVVVNPTTMTIEEITSGLKLDFSAFGRSNNSIDKDIWSFGEYTGTFSGFKWNSSSGWVDNSLKIDNGSVFSINYAPLSNTPTNVGRTLEFEFKTTNVNDDDAVICDLRNDNGVGLLITATKVSLMSEAGVVVENEFRAGENVRLSVVINKSVGSSRKCLSFIYANGCVSRCVNWESADRYNSDTCLSFVGSAGAEVILKYIRIYETALSDDQILNNYIIYRDSVAEMMEVYDRNDVYAKGTTTFSPDKMVSRLPVMVVTGDIPTLENTSDKDTQVIVDIEYTNMQDPSRSFKMVGAAMRPQGTSSMGYPKKNFRIYTQKVANTILYDANGKVVSDKLYSFKEGAIPVDCWCLKADYAESSGTHNTGIARMWNNALYNMQIDGEYVCRTDAQKAALAAGYEYDVRTTIDGFPILLFYKKNATDEPIFIGKYNFNNDKSTEKVFGFTDIPDFDNSRMQCWEILNNGNPLALFQTVDGFDSGWSEAYESRYPDTKTPNTADLKAFSQWMVGINGNAERFATEKWEHFKIYPMAAYYCYLMRHAAADQLVKNAMLTSEDGEKFYFILYDNDTINGLINTGDIDILPTDDRNSVDGSGEFKFAGHGSVLWNMLEADEEFMEIVKEVDNALYSAGISYNECVRIFDEEQADKWVERVYNQDSEYKYVGPYVNNGINNLFMLQGKRDLHRRWWLSKRFSIYDAKFVSGEYKSQAIELKCMNDTSAGQQFSIVAGYPLDYGYGINNLPRETGVTLAVGDSHTFTTSEVVNLGDPIRIYGAPNIEEVDLSPMANRLAVVTIANVYTEALGTRLKKFILGGEGVNNLEVSEISGLKRATMLTHLDVRGMKGIKALDLTSQPYFEELKATGSEIASVSFAKGAPVTRLELPTTMKVLNLEQLPYLTAINLVLADITGIHTINVKGCPNLANDFSWVNNWYNRKTTADSKCTLVMDGINWTGVSPDDLLKIANIGTLELKGKVVLSSITLEQLNALIGVFGESAFDKNADFFINAPDAIFVSGRTELLEGESEDYNCIVFGGEVTGIAWTIVSGGNSLITLDSATGLLSSTEGVGNRTLTIRAMARTSSGTKSKDLVVSIKARVYPNSYYTSIQGADRITNETEPYEVAFTQSGITGNMSYAWSLTGMDEYVEIAKQNGRLCSLRRKVEATAVVSGTLSCTITKTYNGQTLFTVTKAIELVNEKVAETDIGVVTAFYNAGLCENPSFITKEEAARITNADLESLVSIRNQGNNVKSFNGFKWFTGVTAIPNSYFYSLKQLTSVELPDSVLTLGSSCFAECFKLQRVVMSQNLTSIGGYCFQDCRVLKSLELPLSVTTIGSGVFTRCYGLKSVNLPANATINAYMLFDDCYSLESISIPDSVTSISYWSDLAALKHLKIGKNLKTISAVWFGATELNIEVDPDNPNFTSVDGVLFTKDMTKLVAFGKAALLEEYNVPYGVKEIGDYAFYVWVPASNYAQYAPAPSILEHIGLPETIKTFKPSAFTYSSIKSIIIPEGVEVLPTNIFYNCKNLETISLPNSLTTIENQALYGCALKRLVIPENVTSIKTYAFGYNSALEEVIFEGDNLFEFPDSLFHSCKALKRVETPSSLRTLGYNCFSQCALEEITLPSSCVHIKDYCFSYCVALKKITCMALFAPTLGSNVFGNGNSAYTGRNTYNTGENRLYVPSNGIGYDAGGWLDPLCNADKCGFTLSPTLPEIETDIAETDAVICKAFYDAGLCANETYITKDEAAQITNSNLSDVSASIRAEAQNVKHFDGFKYFTKVTEIPASCFRGCQFTSIKFPSSLVKMGYYAFRECSQLLSVELPEGLIALGSASFDKCSALKSVYLPTTLQGEYNFSNKLDSGVLSSFGGCTSLIRITIPSGITILTGAFKNCSQLTEVEWQSTLQKIDDYTFLGCVNLKTIISRATSAPAAYPSAFGNTISDYAGWNTRTTGENMLYVPSGATGYDSGNWASVLLDASKCGFTLSATL